MLTDDPSAMLSIGKLGQGQADYYLQSVAQGIEDYYTGAGEAPGWWTGSAAGELGIEGGVEGELLHRALSGHDPTTGDQLARPPRGGIRVPGFDLTFSAPKSVSVLFGLGDPRLSREVRDAHEAAVAAALGYMERQGAVARRGRGGTESVTGNGFLAAAFRHRTSRAGDPQLHTHVLVANMTRRPDGRWTALDARRLYANAKTGGYLYQAHLRAELTRRLGVEWAPVRHGQAELAGIPQRVLRAFSRRRVELEEQMSQRGDRSARAAQVAALDTRQAKDYGVPAETLAEQWRERARDLGLEPKALRDLTEQTQAQALDPEAVVSVEEELVGPQGLTRQRSTFGRREALQAWCERLNEGADVDVVEALADGLLAREDVVALARDVRGLTHTDVIRRADGRVIAATAEERRYSTAELLALERRILERSLERQEDRAGQVAPERLDAVLRERPELSGEQATMVRRLITGGEGVQVVVGKAGAGKTFALDAARAAWEGDGYRVIGAALARRAAHELHDGAGITSTSIAALLNDLRAGDEGGPALDDHTVLVIDEAGMVGTRAYAELLEHADRAQAKVVLVGDHHQLPEIGAGGVFRGLVVRTDPVELHGNRRQEQAWEREALDLLRRGDAVPALSAYERHGRLVSGDNADDVRARLVADWWQARQDEPRVDAVMVAVRRDDVRDLNGRARALLAAAGRLGSTELDVAGHPFAVGDQVVCLSNARRLGVLNGTRAIVTAVDPERRTLDVQTTDGRDLRLPGSYLDARTERGGPTLDHGYAITGHKAQGMTTGRAFVLGGEDLYREWGYVALSRGRVENRLYLVGREHDRDEIASREPPRDVLDVAAAALRRSRADTLAHDLQDASDRTAAEHRGDMPDTHSSGYLLASLGPRPADQLGRNLWDRAAAGIERYRDQYGVHDPERALGVEPRGDLRQRAAWRQARREAQRVREQLQRTTARDRALARDERNRGRELG